MSAAHLVSKLVLLGGEAGVNGDGSKLLSARPPARYRHQNYLPISILKLFEIVVTKQNLVKLQRKTGSSDCLPHDYLLNVSMKCASSADTGRFDLPGSSEFSAGTACVSGPTASVKRRV